MTILGIVVASVVSFIIAFIWFGPKTFFPVWWRAMGRSADEQPGDSAMPAPVLFGLTILGVLVQATVLTVVLNLARQAGVDVTWLVGLGTGALMGVGFAAATSLSHRLFSGAGLKVWILEVGQDIVCLAAMGLVLSFF